MTERVLNEAATSPQANKGRVLCIDDEPHVLRALQWLLKKDFEVHTCESAADALRMLRKHDFDVVVSDQRMPGITGVEFLRHVRKLAPRAMRILLTGYSDIDAMVGSVNESEVFRFITKPWDVKGLPSLIAEAALVAREGVVPRDDDAPSSTPVSEAAGCATLATAAAPPALTMAAGAPVRASEGVLVIDDSPELHAIADQTLKGSVAVLHAFDLPGALAILGTQAVSVIISEVQVDGLDATRLLFLVRRNHPQIVTLVSSGQQDAEVVMKLINQGQVFRIVPKPLKPAFIPLLVGAALKRHRELLATPSLQRRFAVEESPPQVAESLLADVAKAAAPHAAPAPPRPPAGVSANVAPAPLPPAPALRARIPGAVAIAVGPASALHEPSFAASVKAGFRRLFGS